MIIPHFGRNSTSTLSLNIGSGMNSHLTPVHSKNRYNCWEEYPDRRIRPEGPGTSSADLAVKRPSLSAVLFHLCYMRFQAKRNIRVDNVYYSSKLNFSSMPDVQKLKVPSNTQFQSSRLVLAWFQHITGYNQQISC